MAAVAPLRTVTPAPPSPAAVRLEQCVRNVDRYARDLVGPNAELMRALVACCRECLSFAIDVAPLQQLAKRTAEAVEQLGQRTKVYDEWSHRFGENERRTAVLWTASGFGGAAASSMSDDVSTRLRSLEAQVLDADAQISALLSSVEGMQRIVSSCTEEFRRVDRELATVNAAVSSTRTSMYEEKEIAERRMNALEKSLAAMDDFAGDVRRHADARVDALTIALETEASSTRSALASLQRDLACRTTELDDQMNAIGRNQFQLQRLWGMSSEDLRRALDVLDGEWASLPPSHAGPRDYGRLEDRRSMADSSQDRGRHVARERGDAEDAMVEATVQRYAAEADALTSLLCDTSPPLRALTQALRRIQATLATTSVKAGAILPPPALPPMGMELSEGDGCVVVRSLAAGGMAGRCGLRVGDEIVFVGHQPVRSRATLSAALIDTVERSENGVVPLQCRRGDAVLTVMLAVARKSS